MIQATNCVSRHPIATGPLAFPPCGWTLAILIALTCVTSRAETIARQDIAPKLGQGYDTITGELRGTCVAVTPSGDPTPLNKMTQQISEIKDATELASLAQAGLSFSYSSPTNNAGGSLNWLDAKSLSSYVETFYVRGTFIQSEISGQFVLAKQYATLLNKDPLQFRKTCGDRFVAAYQRGALIQGTITFTTHSEAERSEISAKANASAVAGSVSADYLSTLTSAHSGYNFSINGDVSGLVLAFPSNGPDLMNQSLNIAVTATQHPELLARTSFSLMDYDVLSGSPANVNKQIRANALTKLAGDFATLARAEADLLYLQQNQDQFGPYNPETLSTHSTAINTARTALLLSAQPCIEKDDAANCQSILAKPPVPFTPFRRNETMQPPVNALGFVSVCDLHAGQYARISGTGGWYAGFQHDLAHFRPIGSKASNRLYLHGKEGDASDLSEPRDAGPNVEVFFARIDCCPGNNQAVNFAITSAFYPFPEDIGNLHQ